MRSIASLLAKTTAAGVVLRTMKDKELKRMLLQLADSLEVNSTFLLKANAKDLSASKAANTDRLMLNEERIRAIAASIRKVSKLPNPTGQTLLRRTLPNGIELSKMTVPLGVVAAIYESRPNVTFDISALCLRSQNACLLKGSKEAEQTNKAAIRIIHAVLGQYQLPAAAVTLLPSDRETVTELLKATKQVDVIIPRGSEALIKYVRENSLVPVIETGAGVCHVYVEKAAKLDMACNIAVNAKVSRPTVCNAMDTLIVDEGIATQFLPQFASAVMPYKVEIFADLKAFKNLRGYPYLQKASPQDFGREFLGLQCAIKTVSGIDEALHHIQQHSTRHSEAIVTSNKKMAERFLQEVDAAAVYANASTRFTDGEEFGLGAEIGISTQKLHARGPFALEKLVTEKWVARGTGQVR